MIQFLNCAVTIKTVVLKCGSLNSSTSITRELAGNASSHVLPLVYRVRNSLGRHSHLYFDKAL